MKIIKLLTASIFMLFNVLIAKEQAQVFPVSDLESGRLSPSTVAVAMQPPAYGSGVVMAGQGVSEISSGNRVKITDWRSSSRPSSRQRTCCDSTSSCSGSTLQGLRDCFVGSARRVVGSCVDATCYVLCARPLFTLGFVALAATASVTWGVTTIVCNDKHEPMKLSQECLDFLKDGVTYLVKEVQIGFDDPSIATTGKHFCGFANTDGGNIMCCDSEGGRLIPSTLEYLSSRIIGHLWDLIPDSTVGWSRFFGFETN